MTCDLIKDEGKNHVHKVQLGLVLLVIGLKTGVRFLSQSQSEAMTSTYLFLTLILKLLYHPGPSSSTDDSR